MLRFYLLSDDLKAPTRIKDPKGWDGLGLSIKRDVNWHGVFFEYTPKLQFIKDGRSILQKHYEKYGIEAFITLLVDRFNPVTRIFEREFEGRVNFTSYSISKLYVSINVEKTGFTQNVVNKQNFKVPLTTPVTVSLHSKAIQRNMIGEMTANTLQLNANVGDYFEFSYNLTQDEISDNFPHFFGKLSTLPSDWIKPKEGGTYSFDCRLLCHTLDGVPVSVDTVKWYLQIGGVDHEFSRTGFATTTGASLMIVDHHLVLPNQTINAGDSIILYGKVVSAVSAPIFLLILPRAIAIGYLSSPGTFPADADTKCTVVASTTVPPSNVAVTMVHEAYDQIISNITGKSNAFYSDYFGRTDIGYASDGGGSLRGITKGKLIRNISQVLNASTVTNSASLKDLHDSKKAIDMVGIGVERINGVERARVEPLSFFYPAAGSIKINNVLNVTKEVALDYFFNEFEGGYAKWANLGKQINNLDEVNAGRVWSAPIRQIRNRLSLKCPMITSGYTIEKIRRDAISNTTTENQYDDDNFIIQLRRSGGGFITDKDEDFTLLSGVISPQTVYNAKLSPVRNMLRNPMLRIGLEKQVSQNLILSEAPANAAMQSQLTTEATPVIESGPLPISALPRPPFLPEIYGFVCNLTRVQWQTVRTNPYNFVEFSETTRDWMRGYILEAKRNPNSQHTEFKLLRANV